MASNEATLKLLRYIEEEFDSLDPSRVSKRLKWKKECIIDCKLRVQKLKQELAPLSTWKVWHMKKRKQLEQAIMTNMITIESLEDDKFVEDILIAKGW